MPSFHRRLPLALIATASVLVFSGCDTMPNIQLEPQAKSRIKRIALVEVPEPSNVQVDNLDGVGSPYMVVPPASTNAAGADPTPATSTEDHSTQFAIAIKPLKPGLGGAVQAAIAEGLKADGYEVTVVKSPKKVRRTARLPDGLLPADTDAVMWVDCSVVGYMASFYSGTYEPWLAVNAVLLDPRTDRMVYAKTLCVGYRMKSKEAVFLPAEAKYRYASFTELMKKVGEAYQGLVQCGLAASRRIGEDLRR